MKRILLSLIFMFMLFSILASVNTAIDSNDDYNKTVVKLWQKYRVFNNKDLPKDAVNVLQQIIELSTKYHEPWDFYNAWQTYIKSSTTINWKSRDTLLQKYHSAVDSFNEPIVTYLEDYKNRNVKDQEIIDFLNKERDVMSSKHNHRFYFGAYHLNDLIQNDYEYILWDMLLSNRAQSFVKTELSKLVEHSYPRNAIYAYINAARIPDNNTKISALKEIISQFPNTAVSLYPASDLLLIKKDSLDIEKASGTEYKKLLDECNAFENKRSNIIKGNKQTSVESMIANDVTRVKSLIDRMNEQSLDIDASFVYFRNIPYAQIDLYKTDKHSYSDQVNQNTDKLIYSSKILNPDNSFYTIDSAKIILPELNDGDYILRASYKSLHESIRISQYLLSASIRKAAGGYGIYVADAFDGKPYRETDFSILDVSNDSVLHSVRGLKLNPGFTQLPKSVNDVINVSPDNYFRAVVSSKVDGLIVQSRDISISDNTYRQDTPAQDRFESIVLTDRGAYNPGDTVHFKILGYNVKLYNKHDISTHVATDKRFSVSLEDSDNNLIDTLNLTSNDFGSASGSILIPKDKRNGLFQIIVRNRENDRIVARKTITVDEFILPTFSITFNPNNKLYVPGDSVEITGIVKSYTGDNSSSITLSYDVLTDQSTKVIKTGNIEQNPDGSFSIKFKTEKSSNDYVIKVKGCDNTGETKTFNTFIHVGDYVYMSITLHNSVKSNLSLIPRPNSEIPVQWENTHSLIEDNYIDMNIEAYQDYSEYNYPSTELSYSIFDSNNKLCKSGTTYSNVSNKVDISDLPFGEYYIKADICITRGGDTVVNQSSYKKFLKFNPLGKTLGTQINYLFKIKKNIVESGEDIDILFASTNGPVYAVAELIDDDGNLLYSKVINLSGKVNDANSICNLKIPYEKRFPNMVSFQLLYFKNFEQFEFTERISRKKEQFALPLQFSSFIDKTIPDNECTINIKTDKDIECAATVYDVSLDNINPNQWGGIYFSYYRYNFPSYYSIAGLCSRHKINSPAFAKRYGAMVSNMKSASVQENYVEICDYDIALAPQNSSAGDNVAVRESFADVLTFQPFLRSDKDGNIVLKFKTSDKLSTYAVMLFAHNKSMANNVLRREMLVTLPVRISVMEPKYLYENDKFSLAVSLTNSLDKEISGKVTAYIYNGKDHKNSAPISSESKQIVIGAGSSNSALFPIDMNSFVDAYKKSNLSGKGEDKEIGIKVVFVADKKIDDTLYSDGMFISIPVLKDSQTITEAHSAIMYFGDDKDEIKRMLEGQFTNSFATDSLFREISIIDMIKEAIPNKLDKISNDVLSLTEALYVRLLAEKLGTAVDSKYDIEKLNSLINSCINSDGGFCWFAGMNSSAIITSIVLERFAKMYKLGLIDNLPDFTNKAVAFLDSYMFTACNKFYYSSISIERYLYTRSLYCNVPFDQSLMKVTSSTLPEIKEFYSHFVKRAKNYLTPRGARGYNGQIIDKAKRALTLKNFASSDNGKDMLLSWNIKSISNKKIDKSLRADILSLTQYAVEHKDRCVYFPNAVLPFRGLLESEAYAHSILCDLLTDYALSVDDNKTNRGIINDCMRIADGIRLWLMLQKETQHWDEQPEFVDAINSVLAGSDTIKATKLLAISKSFTKPFNDIKATGNGLSIVKKYYRETVDNNGENDSSSVRLVEIKPGDIINKGDKVVAEYSIWSAENRSFIRVTAPREAGFRPVNQLSGYIGYYPRPSYIDNRFCIWCNANCYREVKIDKTIYYYESYPEEKSVITEEFYATQTGEFRAPIIEIESMYAPHYRANDVCYGNIVIETD